MKDKHTKLNHRNYCVRISTEVIYAVASIQSDENGNSLVTKGKNKCENWNHPTLAMTAYTKLLGFQCADFIFRKDEE
jgi:hypothetical protein